jgi:branched-chain amino acid transport system substrate-binding protein
VIPDKEISMNGSRRFKRFTIFSLVILSLIVALWVAGCSTGSNKTQIVAVVPFSGKGASHGQYAREGIQMYAKDHPNSRLEVRIIDSESDPQKAVTAFEQQVLLQKPEAAISVLSGVSDALAPIAEKKGILLIGVNTATNTFVENYQKTQRINDRPIGHTAPIARLAAQKFPKIGVIYSNDAFGLVCKTTFETTFHETNPSELVIEAYNPSDRDQNLVVQRLLSKKPEAVYVAGYGQAYVSIFQTLRTFKFRGQIFADINFSNPEVLTALGDAAEGVVFAAMDFNISPPSMAKSAAFLASYQSDFKRAPWLGSAFVYDALSIMDSLVNAKRPLDRKNIDALKEWPGIAAQLSFPSPGECRYDFQFVRRVAGKNVRVDLDKLER